MPKRIIDGEKTWRSKKLRQVQPESYRAEYTWLFSLAGDWATFEIDPEIIHSTCYVPCRPSVTLEDVKAILGEFIRVKLLYTWKVGDQTWGYWTGSDKKGLLPSPSQRYSKDPRPDMTDVSRFLNGEPTVALERTKGENKRTLTGFGFGEGMDKVGKERPSIPSPPVEKKDEEISVSSRVNESEPEEVEAEPEQEPERCSACNRRLDDEGMCECEKLPKDCNCRPLKLARGAAPALPPSRPKSINVTSAPISRKVGFDPFSISVPDFTPEEVRFVVTYWWLHAEKTWYRDNVTDEDYFLKKFPHMAAEIPYGWKEPKKIEPKEELIPDSECPKCHGYGGYPVPSDSPLYKMKDGSSLFESWQSCECLKTVETATRKH